MISTRNLYPKLTRLTAFAWLLTIMGTLSSCNDYLTDDPKGLVNSYEAYNTIEKLKNNAVLAVYNYMGGHEKSQGLQGTSQGVYDLNSLTTDEQIIPIRGGDWYDGGLWHRLFFHKWTAGEGPFKDTWDYLFKVVILCNNGIGHIDAYKTDHQNEQWNLRNYKAELRALRAMYYFYLMDLYGRVPLVTQTDVKSNEMTLCERRDLFYWIYNELNESLPYLSTEESQLPNSEYYGRMTVFVAYFVMMKLALNAEIYTDNDWTDNVYPDGKDIQLQTYDILQQDDIKGNAWETVRGIHHIVKQYFKLTEEYSFNFDVYNESSTENIYVIPMDPLYMNKYNYIARSLHYCQGAAMGIEAENGACATVSTIKAFGYDGTDDAVPDLRFFCNFYADNDIFVGEKKVFEDDGVTPLVYHSLAVTNFDLSGKEHEKTAGARMAKYTVDALIRSDGRLSKTDVVLFRFADAILMDAEAAYRLGDMPNALKALNEVYQRSNEKTYTTINDDILLSERLMELMWEGWRRNDLIRFHRFNKPYDLKVSADHEQDAHTTVFPIPSAMLAMHPDWKQNPGY